MNVLQKYRAARMLLSSLAKPLGTGIATSVVGDGFGGSGGFIRRFPPNKKTDKTAARARPSFPT